MKFGTHIFRHTYGKKLTEMHVEDWMIAKLLGHKTIQSVHHYRRIGNRMMADETRKTRENMDLILMDVIKGWVDMKYSAMIEKNREVSVKKINLAKQTIEDMLENHEKISVSRLERETGLSRGFFYKNQDVREFLNDAIRKQGAMYNSNQLIIDKAMENKVTKQKLELTRMKGENTKLKKQNEQLQKRVEELSDQVRKLEYRLNQKEISVLNNL